MFLAAAECARIATARVCGSHRLSLALLSHCAVCTSDDRPIAPCGPILQPTASCPHDCVAHARPPRKVCASRPHCCGRIATARICGSCPVAHFSLIAACPIAACRTASTPQPAAPHSHDGVGYARPPHAAHRPPPSHHRSTNNGSTALARSRALFFLQPAVSHRCPAAHSSRRSSALPRPPTSVLSSWDPAHSSAVPPSVASDTPATRSSLACHLCHPHPPALPSSPIRFLLPVPPIWSRTPRTPSVPRSREPLACSSLPLPLAPSSRLSHFPHSLIDTESVHLIIRRALFGNRTRVYASFAIRSALHEPPAPPPPPHSADKP